MTWRLRPVTLANPVTTFAAGTLIYVGPAAAPVTFYRRMDVGFWHIDA